MCNAEIIMMNTALLVENGTITEDNEINTWIGWKKRGYKVKAGEKHIAEFSIWIKNKKKVEEEPAEETEEETQKPKKKHREFIMTKAFWFSDKQVEKIA